MPDANIITVAEEEDIVCPICSVTILDSEKLRGQPSCAHVRFVYANGEAFEYCVPELEAVLFEEEAKADKDAEVFDTWDALQRHSGPNDVILEQVEKSVVCGPVSFTVWVGIRSDL